MTSERGAADVQAVADALYAAYNARDARAAASLYAPDGVHDEIADGRAKQGPEAIRQGLEHFFAAFPDATWSVEESVVDDRQAVVRYRLTGTLTRALGPFAPLRQRLDIRGVQVVRTDADGRIERSSDYWDAATFRRQMDVAAAISTDVAATGFAPDEFRHAMRLLAGGVVVVTTRVDERPWGLTVSACCSLTAAPPRVLVSLDSRTASWAAIRREGEFGVALLASDQIDVARACSAAGQPKFIEAFATEPGGASGAPVVRDALVHLDCRLESTYAVGDHQLVVGRVREAVSPADPAIAEPLVYFERRFRGIGTPLA